jgi:hypothetical protein
MADGPVRDFGMTATGGWAVAGNDFTTVAGSAAVPQGVKIRAQMWLGEVWLDESVGVDYEGRVLVKNPDPIEVRAEFIQAVESTPDVTAVVGAGLAGPDAQRHAALALQVATVYSPDPVGVQAQVP